MMRGTSAKLDEKTDTLLKKMDTDGDGEMSLSEFQQMNKRSPSMLLPAFELQNQLTEVICSKSWWKKQEASRAKLNLGDLIPLYSKLRDDGDMMGKLERKAARMNKQGCGQGTVTREKGCTVHVKASAKAPILSKLKKGTLVDIADEKTVGDGPKKEQWFRVGSKRWVNGRHIQVLDDAWRRKGSGSGRGKDGGEGGGGGHAGKHKKKKAGGGGGANYKVTDPGDWQKHNDASTGRDYWYSKKLKKTTWKDPHKAHATKKKKPKVSGQ